MQDISDYPTIIPLAKEEFVAALYGLPLEVVPSDLMAASGAIDSELLGEIETIIAQGLAPPEALALQIAILRVHLAKAMQLKAANDSARH